MRTVSRVPNGSVLRTITLALASAVGLSASSTAVPITRDVGRVAIIEGRSPWLLSAGSCAHFSDAAVTNEFYRNHPDEFDTLMIFTTFRRCNWSTANYSKVSNAIRGINVVLEDRTAEYGSRGVLAGVVDMGPIDDVPGPPRSIEGALAVLAQEVEHRWAAYVRFDAEPGPGVVPSHELLGRECKHWSFFLDTKSVTSPDEGPFQTASAMEGQVWRAGDDAGQFRTETGYRYGYCPLDLYLMGLMRPEEVPPFWFVASPHHTNHDTRCIDNSPWQPDDVMPSSGDRVDGVRRVVTIQNIIDVEGAREPAYSPCNGIFRQAFLLLTLPGVDATEGQIAKLQVHSLAWEGYFAKATLGRGAVVTSLGPKFVDRSNTGTGIGSLDHPFKSVVEARDQVEDGGTLVILAGSYPESLEIRRPMRFVAKCGLVIIGR